MAVTDAPGIGSGTQRMNATGPMAAAIGIITTLMGVSLIASSPDKPARSPAPAQVPAQTQPSASVTTPPAPDLAPIPGAPGIQSNQGVPGSGVQAGIEIVVKFKDDGKVKDIIDTFWKDQASAKAKFDAWKSNRPEFAALKLDRVTYSNELVLAPDGSAPLAERLPALKAIVAKLAGLADISYAEPNMTAHPGGQ